MLTKRRMRGPAHLWSLNPWPVGCCPGAVIAAVYQSGAISMPTETAVSWGSLITAALIIGALQKQTFLI